MTIADAIELRAGRWQDVLADVDEVSCLITDPPYGERTHAKQEHGRHLSQDGKHWISARGLTYEHWGALDVREFVQHWSPLTRGWFCVFTSHDLVEPYAVELETAGRYVFAPLPCVQTGMNVRLAGDGPSNWTCWLVVARPRTPEFVKWGTLRGAYIGSPVDAGEQLSDKSLRPVAGAKPLWLMRAIVRDYSRPNDLICDPCAGGATTLLAAALEGRRAIGSEMDADTFAKARLRIDGGNAALRSPTQESLFK